MIKYLYDIFAEKWYRGGTIYLYSDTHFADEEMKYLRKNYIGDLEQVASINSVVGKRDTLIILGDIGDTSFISKIRGYKVAILGNHDAGASKYTDVFNEVYEGPLLISSKIILSHEPVDYAFALNIHGHDHSGWDKRENHVNVCAEWINYRPVSLKSICESGVLKNIPDIHRVTIDKASAKSRKEK